MDDGLGVGRGGELVAQRDQLSAQAGEIVDLAVEDDLNLAVFVAHRLPAGREIDDGQSSMRQAYSVVTVTDILLEKALAIGTPVRNAMRHLAQRSRSGSHARRGQITGNAAHGVSSRRLRAGAPCAQLDPRNRRTQKHAAS